MKAKPAPAAAAGEGAPKPRFKDLSLEQVLDAALRLVRSKGVRHLSMSRLAKELGVTTPAIYYYVDDKQALLEILADRVVASIPVPPRDLPWTDRLRMLLREQERVLREHPGIFRFLIDVPRCRARLRWMELRLEVLWNGGFRGDALIRAFSATGFFFHPFVVLDEVPSVDPNLQYRTEPLARLIRQSGERFPVLEQALPLFADHRFDDHFSVALDHLIASLEDDLASQESAGAPAHARPAPAQDRR